MNTYQYDFAAQLTPSSIALAKFLADSDSVFKHIWYDSIIHESNAKGAKLSDGELEQLSWKTLSLYQKNVMPSTANTNTQSRTRTRINLQPMILDVMAFGIVIGCLFSGYLAISFSSTSTDAANFEQSTSIGKHH